MKRQLADSCQQVVKIIYRLGPYFFPVKMKVQNRKIVETFDWPGKARAYRNSRDAS